MEIVEKHFQILPVLHDIDEYIPARGPTSASSRLVKEGFTPRKTRLNGFCRKTTLTKHQHRSHQLELSSQTHCIPQHSPQEIYSQLPPQPLPAQHQAAHVPEPPPPYQQPRDMVTAAEFYPSHTQSVAHSIPIPTENTSVEPEVHYVGAGMVMPPQIQHFDVTGHIGSISRFQPIPPNVVPNFEALAPMPYNGVFALDKPMAPRILDQYPERNNFDFLGLEG
ncbi:hypothetical protein PRK78_006235 [Emydomyces testavorans]|uniref:Uncharacterized protein n=1 Tax=Emydomyces testavorans TaxID=2070801 RepID=A0AAF0IKN9_9EURO|nr:hypothetical protein PRK78_006235 [Emydomyces testavorans]